MSIVVLIVVKDCLGWKKKVMKLMGNIIRNYSMKVCGVAQMELHTITMNYINAPLVKD